MAFDAYHKWLGIPPKDQPPHHYRLLGLGLYESDSDVIDAAANRQMAYVQSCAIGQHLEQSQVLLNELSAARLCLLTPQRKQQYDALLQKSLNEKRIGVDAASAPADAFSSSAHPSNQVNRKGGVGSLAAKLALILSIGGGGVLGLFVGKSILDSMHPVAEQAIAPEKMEMVVKDSAVRGIPKENPGDLPAPSSSAVTHPTRRPLPARPSLPPAVAATPQVKPVDSPPRQNTDTSPNATTANSIGMKLVLVPAGTYVRGSTDDVDEPQHRVQITRPFYIGETEVTQSQWQAVMATTPWRADKRVRTANDYPATNVTWDEAVNFCRTLSSREGKDYRLPTEAEWEYACRAGTTTKYSFGNDASQLSDYAWFAINAKEVDDDEKYPHVVKQKHPNAWGLYDMHGNVYEWCNDFYGAYPKSDVIDPLGIGVGVERVTRGGSWNTESYHCRSADRRRDSPDFRWTGVGFRVVQQVLPRESLSGQESSIATTRGTLIPIATATAGTSKLPAEATTKSVAGPEATKDTTTAGMAVPGTTEKSVDAGVQSKVTASSLPDELASLRLSVSSQAHSPDALKLLAEQALRLAGQASSAKDEGSAKRLVLLAFQAGQRAANEDIKSRAIKRLLLFGHSAPQTVSIVASRDWYSLGSVRRGDVLVLTAVGTWDTWPGGGPDWTTDAAGTRVPAEESFPLPRAPQGALIGRIGGQRFLVGKMAAVEIETDGDFSLINNDDQRRDDNTGSLIVEVVRIPDEKESKTAALNFGASVLLARRLMGTAWLNSNGFVFAWNANGALFHKKSDDDGEGVSAAWHTLARDQISVTFANDAVHKIVFNRDLTGFTQLRPDGTEAAKARRIK